ncbi:MAG: hypothetical protein Q9Q40_10695 [Acidobacteriota bacterium]|nr:hypothetical protein [Acidobacteriota bacterium]
MKRFLIIAILAAFALSAPVLACGNDAGCCSKANSEMAKGFCVKCATKNVQKTITNLDNGVKILFATQDPASTQQLFKTLQANQKDIVSCKGQCPTKAKGVERQVKMVEGGVLVTVTSPDAEMVQYLQKTVKETLGA